MTFTAPCTQYLGCKPEALKRYSLDKNGVEFLACQDCRLIWRNTEKSNGEQVYDGSYFAKRGYDKRFRHRVSKFDRILANIERFCNPENLLDIGPGLGYALEAARKRGWHVEGLDPSDYVRKVCTEKGFRVEAGTLEAHSLNSRYNLVFMSHVLEHYRNPFRALEEANKLLFNGGMLFVIVPDSNFWKARLKKENYKFYTGEVGGKEHFVYFNKDNLKKALEQSGFKVIKQGFPISFEFSPHLSAFGEYLKAVPGIFGFTQSNAILAKKAD